MGVADIISINIISEISHTILQVSHTICSAIKMCIRDSFAAIRRGRLSWFPSIKRVRRRVLPAFAPLYGRKRKMPNAPLDFFITTTAASPFRANFPVAFYNNRNVWSAKNGRKKSSKSFQTYCLCAAVMGGGYLVLNGGIER